ncbi:hypothetical protein KBG23_00780 [Candidatus Dojkabacteria bacterium]|nr:hypothetical protein [Candidatus Dojkabacteria bacterium]
MENEKIDAPEVASAVGEENVDTASSVPTLTAKPKPNSLLVVLLVVLCLLLIVGGTYAFVRHTIKKESDRTEDGGAVVVKEHGKQDEEVEEVVTSNSKKPKTLDKLFYVKDSNIFSYDITTKEIKKLTSYPENSANIGISNVIDEKQIGFTRCLTVEGDYGCALFTLNTDTLKVEERKKLGKSEHSQGATFATETKFAYAFFKGNKWSLVYENNGVVKILEDITMTEEFGRGGFVEDSSKVAFSPDQKYLLQISTASPRAIMDPTVHVYDLSNDKKDVIDNATQPQWMDSNLIVYRSYDEETQKGDGLYIYNVKTKKSEKINGVVDASYLPNVLYGTKKIVYNVYPEKEIWLYNGENGKNEKLTDLGLDPLWVNESTVVFTSIENCTNDCEGMMDYNVLGVAIFDLKTNTAIFIPEIKDAGSIVTEYL